MRTFGAIWKRSGSYPYFAGADQQGSLKWNVKWYREKASWSYRIFRFSGFLTVFLSVSLPFALTIWPDPTTKTIAVEGSKEPITVTENPWLLSPKDLTAALSWMIALAGGASGFFQWGRTWQSRTEAYMRLERLLMEWEVAVQRVGASVDNVSTATQKLVVEARETIKAETGAFFEEIQFPEVDAPEKPGGPGQ